MNTTLEPLWAKNNSPTSELPIRTLYVENRKYDFYYKYYVSTSVSQQPFNSNWSSEYYARKWNRSVGLKALQVDKKLHARSVGRLNLL